MEGRKRHKQMGIGTVWEVVSQIFLVANFRQRNNKHCKKQTKLNFYKQTPSSCNRDSSYVVAIRHPLCMTQKQE